jgi:hypothetical protein
LGNSLEFIFLHRSLCRHSVTVHLPRRNLHRGTKITRREIIQNIPSSRCDAPQKTERQDVRARVIPWPYVCFQRCGPAATWELIRVLFTSEECTESPRGEVGKVDCCWCHKWRHREVCRFTFFTTAHFSWLREKCCDLRPPKQSQYLDLYSSPQRSCFSDPRGTNDNSDRCQCPQHCSQRYIRRLPGTLVIRSNLLLFLFLILVFFLKIIRTSSKPHSLIKNSTLNIV